MKPNKRFFIKLNSTAIIAVYLLILVGGIVRSMGMGLGCPDFPKCFENYIPPTDISQIPENYKEVYTDENIEKKMIVSSFFSAIGFNRIAYNLLNDDIKRDNYSFNINKAWFEYGNRIIGFVVGVLVVTCFISSFVFLNFSLRVVLLSLVAVLLVLFNGWMYSISFSSNFMSAMTTFNFVLSITLIAILINIRFSVNREHIDGIVSYKPYKVKRLLILSILLFLSQVVLGTQVREAIDGLNIKHTDIPRFEWINSLGFVFIVHRSYSFIILSIQIYLVYRLIKSVQKFRTSKLLIWSLTGFVLFEIMTGFGLAYFSLPYIFQPVHLILSVLIFGSQYYLFLIINEKLT